MTWARLDDSFAEHPKVGRLSDAAFRAHVTAICYSARLLTDGFVPDAAVRAYPRKAVEELRKIGLWEREPDGSGWWLHDYLDYNPTRERVLAKRASDAARKRGGVAEEPAPDSKRESQRPRPDPASPLTSTAPTAYAANGKSKPSEDQLYLLKRLFEHDSNWSSVTPGALVQLNRRFGRELVHEALQDLREAPPDEVQKSAYGLIQRTCEAKQEASA